MGNSMIEKIFKTYHDTNFDFRPLAYPNDELSYLFDEWVPYYRMIYAVCKTISPKSILEVGVRFGYSAITFLIAAPDATYFGIDIGMDSFGKSCGDINWAKKITASYNARFLVADAQRMTILPGDFYDLIHIDGHQDGDETFHNLQLALPKARWILLDGYLLSNENMLSATFFLKKYRYFIEYSLFIPGYTGHLLIKVKENAKNMKASKNKINYPLSSDLYDQEYFTNDCGGYDSFKRYKGQKIEDPRLIAAYCLADPRQNKKILDIGCGRGELAFALASAGAEVIGLDYSIAAFEIAQKTYGKEIMGKKIHFVKADFLEYPLNSCFDFIFATDFIEHIEHKTLDRVIKKISLLLLPKGLAVFHTAPNRLYYEKYYPTLREKAREAGAYLPENPRTYYEDLMHINEQTPEELRTLLEKYFQYVIVWVVGDYDMLGSLAREYSLDEINASRGIFAVASHAPLSKERLIADLTKQPIKANHLEITIKVNIDLNTLPGHKKMQIPISILNRSNERLVSLPPNPVHISYHWADENGKILMFEGLRTTLNLPIRTGEERSCLMDIITPEKEGKYRLQITLVQEWCFWFEDRVKSLPLDIIVEIDDEKGDNMNWEKVG
jgi:SAM-dependent methyltransferase